jgi:hypothetical protein
MLCGFFAKAIVLRALQTRGLIGGIAMSPSREPLIFRARARAL